MKKALVVGIDDYPSFGQLHGCVNDAKALAHVLGANQDNSPNFEVKRVSSDKVPVTSELLFGLLSDLFSRDAETVLFYFAGHGIINEESDAGYLVTQDGRKPNWGISLTDILNMANGA